MARDIDQRLRSLRDRRTGLDRLGVVDTASVGDLVQKSQAQELWETRQTGNKYTRYALGAMQPVGSEYTTITVETAQRVGRQLESNLSQSVSFKLQGSVPLNVHIRGVSDVDLLVLHGKYITFDPSGPNASNYTPLNIRTVDTLLDLRNDCETTLKDAYPAVKVDCSGGKAITLTGGSLPRPVDVVPSEWHDNATYQATHQESDRGVVILNKKVPETITNLPFLHIRRINEMDDASVGGLKKAIRLVKNVKNDSDDVNTGNLPSFDIAALLFHADQTALSMGRYYELAVLAEAQRFFDWCYRNKDEARLLMTPDGTRRILNTTEKEAAVLALSVELDDLAKRVAKEQNALVLDTDRQALSKVLRESVIP